MQIPKKESFGRAVSFLGAKEWKIFIVLFILLLASVVGLLYKINAHFLVTIPVPGGELHEGIVGTPRFINPVLATTNADEELTSVIFSGLMRKDSEGNFVPDLADSYTMSPDGLVYTFTLRKDIFFHDKTPIRSADVIYTIEQIQKDVINSPEKGNFEGVIVSTTGEDIVVFTLKKPYASFIENMSIGILPSHIWKNIPDTEFSFDPHNINPIGEGPYMVKSVAEKDGTPLKYTLTAFSKYFPKAHINKLTFTFYANEEDLATAYRKGAIDEIHSLSGTTAASLAADGEDVETIPLSRVFGLFFNTTAVPFLAEKNTVLALEHSIDKKKIVNTILHGFGTDIHSPVPSFISELPDTSTYDPIIAADMLAKAGWQKGPTGILEKKNAKKEVVQLRFSIATGDTPELSETAKLIKEDLEKIGASVEVKVYDSGKLNQDVIKNRSFDVLFFGQIINHQSDLYAFWHSSQRKSPGLNISEYANPDADKVVSQLINETDLAKQAALYHDFENIFAKDPTAIFIYSPKFIYIAKKSLVYDPPTHISGAAERFIGINSWYARSDTVWKIFSNSN